MLRRDWFIALGVGTAIALALAAGARLRRDPAAAPPRTLQQIARMADTLGLHHRSDIENGAVSIRLIISDRPLTFVRANSLHMGNPGHPCWHGTVAACAGGRAYTYLCDGEHGVLWGDVLLYGDPALIRQIMAAPVLEEPRIEEESAVPEATHVSSPRP